MEKNVQINRKKLGRFLDSLKGRTTEELQERKRIGEKYICIESNFLTIKDTTSQVLLDNHLRRTRDSYLSTKPPETSTITQEEDRPKYIPASKYPLPMSPMQYRPAQKCKNASRLLNLSKLRPQRSHSSCEVENKREMPKMSFPDFTVEKIDFSVY